MTHHISRRISGFLFLLCLSLAPQLSGAQNPPPAVTFAVIGQQPASQPLNYLGRIEAINHVDVNTRTDGFIQAIHFVEGQMVTAGDLLFEIDPNVHQSAVDQAKAQVAAAEATLSLASVALSRVEALFPTRAASQADVDRARADRDVARANLAQAQATLQARELTLGFTRITAPISGRIGHTRFAVGSYISPTSGTLVDIVQLDPIRVVIAIKEQDFISATLQDSRLHLDLLGKDFAPQLRLANGKIYTQRGVLDSIDNKIDQQTGTVDVRARFANPDHILLPGGVVDVNLDATEPPMVPAVPISALQQDQTGHFVLVLDDKDAVVVRPVKLGMQLGQDFEVRDGLAVGERVIVEGLQRVRPGMTVRPVPAITPAQ